MPHTKKSKRKKPCKVCKRRFVPQVTWQAHDSNACRQKAYRARKKEGQTRDA